jgi:Domain of unknown function (DUF4292)
MFQKILFLFFACCILSVSCATSKKKNLVKNINFENIKVDSLISLIKSRQDFNYLSFKGTASINIGNEKIQGKVSLIAEKNNMAIISIKKYGIEAFRVLASVDIVCIINRIDETWHTYYPDAFHKQFGLHWNINILTDILLGGNYISESLAYIFIKKPTTLVLSGVSNSLHTNAIYEFNNCTQSSLEVKYQEQRVNLNFENYTSKEGHYFPLNIKGVYQSQQEIKNNFNVHWEELEFKPISKFHFEIPPRFQKI